MLENLKTSKSCNVFLFIIILMFLEWTKKCIPLCVDTSEEAPLESLPPTAKIIKSLLFNLNFYIFSLKASLWNNDESLQGHCDQQGHLQW